VELLWRAAPRVSLAHDVSDGGLATALAEAALWSGVGAQVDLPADEPLGGAAIVACRPDECTSLEGFGSLTRIGTVGGKKLLGRKLDDIRAEWAT
jgi:phosphoribosylformylglycinamidine synthase